MSVNSDRTSGWMLARATGFLPSDGRWKLFLGGALFVGCLLALLISVPLTSGFEWYHAAASGMLLYLGGLMLQGAWLGLRQGWWLRQLKRSGVGRDVLLTTDGARILQEALEARWAHQNRTYGIPVVLMLLLLATQMAFPSFWVMTVPSSGYRALVAFTFSLLSLALFSWLVCLSLRLVWLLPWWTVLMITSQTGAMVFLGGLILQVLELMYAQTAQTGVLALLGISIILGPAILVLALVWWWFVLRVAQQRAGLAAWKRLQAGENGSNSWWVALPFPRALENQLVHLQKNIRPCFQGILALAMRSVILLVMGGLFLQAETIFAFLGLNGEALLRSILPEAPLMLPLFLGWALLIPFLFPRQAHLWEVVPDKTTPGEHDVLQNGATWLAVAKGVFDTLAWAVVGLVTAPFLFTLGRWAQQDILPRFLVDSVLTRPVAVGMGWLTGATILLALLTALVLVASPRNWHRAWIPAIAALVCAGVSLLWEETIGFELSLVAHRDPRIWTLFATCWTVAWLGALRLGMVLPRHLAVALAGLAILPAAVAVTISFEGGMMAMVGIYPLLLMAGVQAAVDGWQTVPGFKGLRSGDETAGSQGE